MNDLSGRTIAVLVASGSDQGEFVTIRDVLADAGAEAVVVSPKKQSFRAWRNTGWGDDFPVDVPVMAARAESFDGLMIPGGLIGADTLRSDGQAVDLVRAVHRRRRPLGAIGHAAWLLVEADLARGRAVTGIEAVRTDLANAGGRWVDAVSEDGGLVTGRHRDDVAAVMARFAAAARA